MLSLNFGTELSAANLHFTHIITFDFISSLACTAKELYTLHYTKTVPSSKANNCWNDATLDAIFKLRNDSYAMYSLQRPLLSSILFV